MYVSSSTCIHVQICVQFCGLQVCVFVYMLTRIYRSQEYNYCFWLKVYYLHFEHCARFGNTPSAVLPDTTAVSISTATVRHQS